MRKLLLSALLGLGFAVGVNAADTDQPAVTGQGVEQRFDHRIDSWVNGTIVTLDADGQKFSVRGKDMPFASAHSQMLKEIAQKTANLNEAEKQAKTQEIRTSWQDKLNTARQPSERRVADYNFALPAKGQLMVVDEKRAGMVDFLHQDRVGAADVKHDRGANVTVGVGDKAADVSVGKQGVQIDTSAERARIVDVAGTDAKEAQAMQTLRDLKIGDHVMVGYDDGVITNEAYVVIRAQDAKSQGQIQTQGQPQAK